MSEVIGGMVRKANVTWIIAGRDEPEKARRKQERSFNRGSQLSEVQRRRVAEGEAGQCTPLCHPAHKATFESRYSVRVWKGVVLSCVVVVARVWQAIVVIV